MCRNRSSGGFELDEALLGGLVVRVGGLVYAGALLRTGGKVKLREALRAERA